MDFIMESRGNRAWGTSRLGQGEQEDWSKGKRGTGPGGACRLEPWGAAGLSQGEQEVWAMENRRTGPWGAGTGPGEQGLGQGQQGLGQREQGLGQGKQGVGQGEQGLGQGKKGLRKMLHCVVYAYPTHVSAKRTYKSMLKKVPSK
jgi:hypothetical protein